MRVIILTTSVYGTAGHHLPVLLNAKGIEVAAVVVSTGVAPVKNKRYSRVFKKILKIGVLGAINGIRMRKWFTEDLNAYHSIKSVEDTCRTHHVRFETVPYTNSKETQQLFKELNADVGLSLGNGFISPRVFEIPKYGMLNIHHEILPDYQNAQSILWQIYNGSKETGYTIHKIDRNIDTGEILYQEKIPISFKDTLGETVSFTLANVLDRSAEGLKKVLENFEHYYSNARPQGKGNKYTTPSYWQYRTMQKQFTKLKTK